MAPRPTPVAHAAAPQPQPCWPATLRPCRRRSRRRLPPAPGRRSSRGTLRHRRRHWSVAQTPVSGRTSCTSSAAVHVAGDRRDNRARLLVAGQQQEGRRAAVALDADGVEARLRMGELAMAVRRDRAAGVQVGIDQRARAPARSPARDRARAAARASWPRSGRWPVATTIRSTGGSRRGPCAVGPRGRCAAIGSTAVAAKPVTSVTRRARPACEQPHPSLPRAGSWSASPPP